MSSAYWQKTVMNKLLLGDKLRPRFWLVGVHFGSITKNMVCLFVQLRIGNWITTTTFIFFQYNRRWFYFQLFYRDHVKKQIHQTSVRKSDTNGDDEQGIHVFNYTDTWAKRLKVGWQKGMQCRNTNLGLRLFNIKRDYDEQIGSLWSACINESG